MTVATVRRLPPEFQHDLDAVTRSNTKLRVETHVERTIWSRLLLVGLAHSSRHRVRCQHPQHVHSKLLNRCLPN